MYHILYDIYNIHEYNLVIVTLNHICIYLHNVYTVIIFKFWWFDKKDNFKKLPPMLLDCIASRMQINNSNADILYQYCVPFSLVKQGLLARKRINTPLLSIGHQNDIMCNKQDLRMIARASREGESHIIDKPPIFESYLKALSYSAQWLTRHLGE